MKRVTWPAVLLLLLAPLARGSEDRAVDDAVATGLKFLASAQEKDGSWRLDGSTGNNKGGPRLAVTALATTALLASGNTPSGGPFAAEVRRAVDFMIRECAKATDAGYLGRIDGSRMYGHGIITLTLIEAMGVEPDPARRAKLHAILRKAVDVILAAQALDKPPEHAGGWRYNSDSRDSDLSLSGWNALALRAAQNSGIEVPKQRVERAVRYVLACYNKDQGGFSYQPQQSARPSTTGVAVLSLYLLDGTERPELASGVKYLRQRLIREEDRFPFYAIYYTTQAANQAGGETWEEVWAHNRQLLLSTQLDDGGWPQSRNGEEPGRVYATALATLTLAVPQKLLPIYQR